MTVDDARKFLKGSRKDVKLDALENDSSDRFYKIFVQSDFQSVRDYNFIVLVYFF